MNILKAAALVVFAAATAALPLVASAQQPAVTAARQVRVHAGPDGIYPVVAVLPPRAGVTVFGCLSGYSWCDIGFGIDRGWVHASTLRYYYQDRYVPVARVATIVGIGYTTFIFDDYWGRYYRERRFYSDQDRWYRGPPPRAWSVAPAAGFAPEHRANHGQGFPPSHAQVPGRQMPQPVNSGQLTPPRPNGGQPGMHAPHSHSMQPTSQAVTPPARGVVPPRPVPQVN